MVLDSKYAFSTLLQWFTFVHLFYTYLTPCEGFSLTAQYLIVAFEAPQGGLLAAPVSRQWRACLHLFYSIEKSVLCATFHSRHTSHQLFICRSQSFLFFDGLAWTSGGLIGMSLLKAFAFDGLLSPAAEGKHSKNYFLYFK